MNIHEMFNAIRDRRYCQRPYMGHRCYVFMPAGSNTLIYSSNGYDAPWVPGHDDLLADDWVEIIPHP